MSTVDHVLLTRFNLRSAGNEGRVRAQAAEGLCQLVYRDSVGPAETRQDIAVRLSTHDDGLAHDVPHRIQTVPTTAPRSGQDPVICWGDGHDLLPGSLRPARPRVGSDA